MIEKTISDDGIQHSAEQSESSTENDLRSVQPTGESIYVSVSATAADMADDLSLTISEASVPISTFTITTTSDTAFIAGYGNLTWSDFKSGYSGYYYQNSDIVDAEKCSSITQDNMMCWAATAANMLYYTGWLLDTTSSEDDVFSVFINNFTKGKQYGGNAYYGIDWFFTGNYTPKNWSEWDVPLSDSGGFYKEVFTTKSLSSYLSSTTVSVNSFATVKSKLEAGCAVGISFGYYNSSGERTGGHAITMWGMTCDTSLSVSDPNYYTGIIVSDSDDNKSVSDPLNASDTLKIISITYDSDLKQYVLDPAYAGNARLESFQILAQNDNSVPNTSSIQIYSSGTMVKQGKIFKGEILAANQNNSMFIYSGGTAENTQVSSGAVIYVNGGIAKDTNIGFSGSVQVSSGGKASNTLIAAGGELYIFSDGETDSAAVSGGKVFVASGGTAKNTTLFENAGLIISGGTASGTTAAYGSVNVYSGGMAVNTELNSAGKLYIHSGGTVYDTTVTSGGSIDISSDGRHRGTLQMAQGANVNAAKGGIVDFTVAGRETGDGYLINNLSLIKGTVTYTITVNGDQGYGTYKLAQGATGFTGTLTIGTESVNYGSITVNGEDFVINNTAYSLDNAGGNLTLSISKQTTPVENQVKIYSKATLVKQGKIFIGETIASGKNDTMNVSSGGIVSNTIINSLGWVYVSNGGLALDTNIAEDNGRMIIRSGGKAERISVEKFGHISAYGGTVSSALLKDGIMAISGGGVANNINMTNAALYVGSGGTANNINASGSSHIYVSSAGRVSNTVVSGDQCENGRYYPMTLNVHGGGYAENTSTLYHGVLLVSSGGSALDATCDSGYIAVLAGGKVTDVDIWKNGQIRVWGEEYAASENDDPEALHGYAEDVIVSGGGQADVCGGEISNIQVLSGGQLYVSGVSDIQKVDVFGKLNHAEIKSGAELFIGEGGVELNGNLIFGGKVTVENWAFVYGNITFDLSERSADDSCIIDNLSDLMLSDIAAYSISVAADQANGTYILAENAGDFNYTVSVSSGTETIGYLTVGNSIVDDDNRSYSLALKDSVLSLTVNSTPIPAGDQVKVYSGKTLVKQGKILTGEKLTSSANDTMYVSSGGTADRTTILSGGRIYVSSGGLVTGTIIDQAGSHTSACGLYISNGGMASSTVLTGDTAAVRNHTAHMRVFRGGTADLTTVNRNAWLVAEKGSIVTNTTVTSQGFFSVFGATADGVTLSVNGGIFVQGQSHVTNITASKGSVLGISIAPDTYIQGTYAGSGFEVKDGEISGFTIYDSGYMYVSSGGTAIDTTLVGGSIWSAGAVLYGMDNGFASNTVVSSGGRMYMSSGFAAEGLTLYTSGYAYLSAGSVVDTVIEGGMMSAGRDAVASNTIVNAGKLYLGEEAVHSGSLKIARGTTIYASENSIIDFSVGEQSVYDTYLINDLSLITGAPTYQISVSIDQENGTYKLAQGAENFTETITIGDELLDYGSITVNGEDLIFEGRSYSLDQVDGDLTLTISKAVTKVVDGDLDGNGLADVLLVHSKQGFSGTWFVTGGTPAIEWGNLSTIGKNVELIGVGNVYNSTESQDIFLKNGSTIAAWVMEEGKVKSYKGLYNVNSNMNFIGLGDFNGDGTTDYLLRSKSGDLGYISSNDNKWHYFKGLGSEWEIAAIGDLNNDGLDDVVLRHDAGYVGTYLTQENGSVKWANLDTLKNDMTIIGTGDFNGDGVDDVLLQKDTGWVGAWLVKDGSVDDFMGICTTKTTIEQIADFNGDGIDDLRVRTDAGDIGIRYVYGADNTSWKYLKSVGEEWETKFSALA